MYEIDDLQAAEVASAWHSVMTWSDPGVAMYSVTSTGKVHSDKHRAQLLAYIDTCISAAEKCDERGEESILGLSNVDDLEALREWAMAYTIGGGS